MDATCSFLLSYTLIGASVWRSIFTFPPSCHVASSFGTCTNFFELLQIDNSRTFLLKRRPAGYSLVPTAIPNNITRVPLLEGKTLSSSTSSSPFFGPRAFKASISTQPLHRVPDVNNGNDEKDRGLRFYEGGVRESSVRLSDMLISFFSRSTLTGSTLSRMS